MLPGTFDGIELLDRIGALGKDRSIINVIMMSGNDAGSDCVKHGAYDFVAKPIVKEVLLHKMDMLLQHRKAEMRAESDRRTKAALCKAIEELSARAFHTPVQVVAESVAAVLARPDLTKEARADLDAVRKLIMQNTNFLFRPTMDPSVDLDPVSRSFLFNELALSVPEMEFAQTSPDNAPDDPVVLKLAQWSLTCSSTRRRSYNRWSNACSFTWICFAISTYTSRCWTVFSLL